ncbi:MAG: hypothetical protein AAGI08_06055 [Bacteroidota bacterium]
MRLRFLQPLVFVLAALLTLPAFGQGVTYKQETRMSFEGLGFAGRLANQKMESEVWIQGAMHREDTKKPKQSTIIDLENERYIFLDHKEKTYSSVSFAEYAEKIDAMIENVGAEMEAEQQDQDVRTNVSFDVDAGKTGRRKEVNGFDAEQTVMTMRIDYDAETEEGTEVQGTMFVVTDMWMAVGDEDGVQVINAYNQRMAAEMGEALQGTNFMDNMGEAGGMMDPRLGAGMTKMMEEMKDMAGFAVQTNMHYVLVPEGEDLDVDAVIGEKKKKGGGGLLGGLQRMANAASGGQTDVEEQMTILKTSIKVKDMKTKSIKTNRFEIPSKYKERPFSFDS